MKRKWPAISDHLLFFTKSPEVEIDPQYKAYPERTLREWYLYLELCDGSTRRMTKQEIESQQIPAGARRFNTGDMSAPSGGGMAAINKETGRPNGWHIYKGYIPPDRGWRYSPETMAKLDADRLLLFPTKSTGRIMLKRYLDEQRGVVVGDVWDDIQHLRAAAGEALGYPTQKPLALLERIIAANTKLGDVVLDPFCGCGTAVHAAQKLNRRWIGIDVTHLAISLVEKRLKDAFPSNRFEVHGTPKDLEGAQDLAARDKYQFQWWACSIVNAQPYGGKKKGADGGVDGLIYFQDEAGLAKKIIVSVKGGENIGVTMIKDLIATIARQKAEIGLFVTLNPPTRPMMAEATAAGFYKSPTGATFPRIQILEVESLINGTRSARYPSLDAGSLTFKKAAVEEGEDKQVDLFSPPSAVPITRGIANKPRRPPKRMPLYTANVKRKSSKS